MQRRLRQYANRNRRDFNGWSFTALAVTLFIGVPTIFIFVKLFSGPGESWKHIATYLLPGYLRNSLYLALTTSFLTICFGVGSAWLSTRYEFPMRKAFEWLLILPLAIPSYITAYAYAGIFDYGGSLALLLRQFSLTMGKLDIMNIHGLAFVLGISLYPYVYVACRAFFLHQSQHLIEASKALGKGETRSFFKLILPIARPAIVGGVILVLMEVLNDYGAAKYYGVNTFTTGIFKSWFGYREPETAVYLSALLLAIIFGLILLEQWQRKRKKFVTEGKGGTALKRIQIRKKYRLLFTAVVGLPVMLGFVFPVLQLVYWASLAIKGIQWDQLYGVVLQSLLIAALAATCCVFFSVVLLLAGHSNRLRWVQQFSKVGVLGYAIPGAIIAVGVYIPGLYVDKWLISVFKQFFSVKIGLLITGTVIALLYAYVVRFLAVAYNPIASGKQKVPNGLIEASKSLGKNTLSTFWNVELPLLKPALLGSFILVFIDVMKELPLTLILKPYTVQTLAIEAYQYASDERIAEAAFPSLLIVATGVLPVIFLNRLARKD